MSALSRKYFLIFGIAALAFILIGAAVGVVLIFSGGSDGSVRDLTLQPVDVPQNFVLAEEKLLKRDEAIAQLPAESQIAEKGLNEAVQVTYQSQDGPLIDVRVYSYEDEDAAKTAHRLARNDNPDVLHPVNLRNGMSGYAFNDAQVVEGTGDDPFLMTGIASRDDGDPQTADQSFDVRIYFMHKEEARAEVLVAGSSMFLDPDVVARNQYLRLGNLNAVSAGERFAATRGSDEAPPGETGNEDAVRKMALQPGDLPQDFALGEERLYTADEFRKELPAGAQISEGGLRHALRRTFLTSGASPAQVDVLLYIYEDANAAKSGQEYLRNDDGLYAVMRRLNSGRELRDFDATTGGDPEFGEDSWTAEIKGNPYVENPSDTSIYAMRYANVRAEISVTVQPSVNLHPKDLARSQLQRIQRGSLSAGS